MALQVDVNHALKGTYNDHKVDVSPSRPDVVITLPHLTPKYIETMLARRLEFQAIKFRTTCSDCVPNL